MHVGGHRLLDRFDLDILGCAVTYLLVGFSAESVLKARPRASKFVSHFSGSVMILLGTILLTELITGRI